MLLVIFQMFLVVIISVLNVYHPLRVPHIESFHAEWSLPLRHLGHLTILP